MPADNFDLAFSIWLNSKKKKPIPLCASEARFFINEWNKFVDENRTLADKGLRDSLAKHFKNVLGNGAPSYDLHDDHPSDYDGELDGLVEDKNYPDTYKFDKETEKMRVLRVSNDNLREEIEGYQKEIKDLNEKVELQNLMGLNPDIASGRIKELTAKNELLQERIDVLKARRRHASLTEKQKVVAAAMDLEDSKFAKDKQRETVASKKQAPEDDLKKQRAEREKEERRRAKDAARKRAEYARQKKLDKAKEKKQKETDSIPATTALDALKAAAKTQHDAKVAKKPMSEERRQKRAAYMKKWNAKNKEYAKKYYKENKSAAAKKAKAKTSVSVGIAAQRLRP